MLTTLFSRALNADLVCDAVASLLANEEANQRALATGLGQDPEPLRVRVYLERTAPISDWIDITPDTDASPIVNVRLERDDAIGGNVIEQQRCKVHLALECFAVGCSERAVDGFTHGEDLSLAKLRQTVGFVRGVLMAAENTYLGLRGVVTKRWIDSSTRLPVDFSQDPSAQHIRACKLSLVVDTFEVSPQTEGVPLASVRVRLLKESDGQVLASSVILAEEQ